MTAFIQKPYNASGYTKKTLMHLTREIPKVENGPYVVIYFVKLSLYFYFSLFFFSFLLLFMHNSNILKPYPKGSAEFFSGFNGSLEKKLVTWTIQYGRRTFRS